MTQGSAPTILTAGYRANNHAGGEDANGNPGSIRAYIRDFGRGNLRCREPAGRRGWRCVLCLRAGNKRVWRGTWTGGAGNWTRGTDEITFFSVSGQKLAAYALTTVSGTGSPQFYATQTETNYYFGSKLIKNANDWVYWTGWDRTASFIPTASSGPPPPPTALKSSPATSAIPRPSTITPTRGISRRATGGSYANRMTGKPANPSSWNKYASPRRSDKSSRSRRDRRLRGRRQRGGLLLRDLRGLGPELRPELLSVRHMRNRWTRPAAGTHSPGRSSGSTNPALNTPAAANGATTQAWALVGEQLALGVLESNPDCSNFIGIPPVGGPDPATLLAEIWSGTSTVASVEFGYISDTTDANGNITGWENAVTGASAPCGTFQPFPTFCSHATIELNTNASTPDNYAPTAQAWAVTILHELGHVYQWLYSQDSTSVQYDDPNVVGPGPSQMNTANILSLCFP